MHIIEGYWDDGAKEWLVENKIKYLPCSWIALPLLCVPFFPEKWVTDALSKVIIFSNEDAMAFKLIYGIKT